MFYSLGIDIGGMSIKGGIVDEKGNISLRFVQPINNSLSQEEIIDELIQNSLLLIEKFDKKQDLIGIGIGIPGSIDTQNGIVNYNNNLHWNNLHIVEMFNKKINLPVSITNDANAAALAEATFGAGKKYSNVIVITLGTGVGGGIIIDGKLFEGYKGLGAELGHMIIQYNGEQCTCGRKGCLETYASATALIRQTKKAMEDNKDSLLWKEADSLDKVNGKTVFDAAQKGDKVANFVVNQYVSYLGEGLLNFCNIFRPECIVLSGGIAKQGAYLTDKLTKYCADRDYGYKCSPATIIKVAELEYDAGIVGAALLKLIK